MTIATLPLPPRLAIPLPDDCRPLVAPGQTVRGGECLAQGRESADVLSPGAARVTGFTTLPLATPQAAKARCIVLAQLREDNAAVTHHPTGTIPDMLKRAGIVGLGGGAFPAWRKWRLNLRLMIINAVESDPLSRHDRALLEELGDELPRFLQTLRERLRLEVRLAVSDDAPAINDAGDGVIRVAANYAAGSERLLMARLTGLPPPTAETFPADVGVVCFNIATALAIYAALTEARPMTGRVVTVHHKGCARLLRVPFGVAVADIRRYLSASGTFYVGGTDEQTAAADSAVITAASHILADTPLPTPSPLPCIHCGACDAACPVSLPPQALYHAVRDGGGDDDRARAAALGLGDCLSCRACDDVCPSHIPLTKTFNTAKKQLQKQKTEQELLARRQWRYERHNARTQSAQEPDYDPPAMKQQARALIEETLRAARQGPR